MVGAYFGGGPLYSSAQLLLIALTTGATVALTRFADRVLRGRCLSQPRAVSPGGPKRHRRRLLSGIVPGHAVRSPP